MASILVVCLSKLLDHIAFICSCRIKAVVFGVAETKRLEICMTRRRAWRALPQRMKHELSDSSGSRGSIVVVALIIFFAYL